MKNKDVFKKHHFWILLGAVPLLVFIAVITISSSVGSAVESRNDAIKKAGDMLRGKENPKSEELIKRIDQQASKVYDKKLELWKMNWDRQKDMYVWPNSPRLKEIERMNLKFGDKIPNDRSQYLEFTKPEVYLAEFSTANPKKNIPPSTGMADRLAPTQFKDGWQAVLRHVSTWDERQLTSEQIWLMMEDIWIQRSMLEAVRSVNAQMAEFRRVKFEKDGKLIDDPADPARDNPLHRKFHSRIWDLELEVVPGKGGGRSLTGRLINHTDRLQLMGLNNTMIVKVWLDKEAKQPFEFKIGGEFLPGRGVLKADRKTPANVLDILPTDDHILPPTLNVKEIVKVEQVFDTRTVPVRRIEALELCKTDSRFADKQMQMPLFDAFKKEQEAAAAAAQPKGPESGPGTGPRPGPIGGPPFGPGGIGGPGTGVGQRSGGGTVDTVLNANKKRYVEVTPGVRRMPVAVAVVVDQAYMQDVLLAFANSQLKFQITQVNWNRFRGTLATGTNDPNASPDPINQPAILSSGPGNFGEGFGPRGPKPNIGPGPMGPIGPGPMGPVGPFGPGSPFGPTGSLATVSESQLTSGLIELSIYGVVSLYEKFAPPGETPKEAKVDPKPKEPVADPKDKEPKDPKSKEPVTDPKEKEPKDPKDKEPKGKDAAMPEAKGAKMRRRVR